MDTTLLGVIIGGCLANIHHIIDCIKWICKSAYLYISKKINKSKQQKEQKYYSEKIINLIKMSKAGYLKTEKNLGQLLQDIGQTGSDFCFRSGAHL